jgi:hypothetical protein
VIRSWSRAAAREAAAAIVSGAPAETYGTARERAPGGAWTPWLTRRLRVTPDELAFDRGRAGSPVLRVVRADVASVGRRPRTWGDLLWIAPGAQVLVLTRRDGSEVELAALPAVAAALETVLLEAF